MNLIKIVGGKTLLDIEEEINNFLTTYNGELIQFQVIKDTENSRYEAIISYKQSNSGFSIGF